MNRDHQQSESCLNVNYLQLTAIVQIYITLQLNIIYLFILYD